MSGKRVLSLILSDFDSGQSLPFDKQGRLSAR